MAGGGKQVEREPGGAGALVTPQGVVAGARSTDAGMGKALVDIYNRQECPGVKIAL